jgi:hypothetical protein
VKIIGELEMVVRFGRRAKGNCQVSDRVGVGAASGAFDDVRLN